jgi:hypothetical protein
VRSRRQNRNDARVSRAAEKVTTTRSKRGTTWAFVLECFPVRLGGRLSGASPGMHRMPWGRRRRRWPGCRRPRSWSGQFPRGAFDARIRARGPQERNSRHGHGALARTDDGCSEAGGGRIYRVTVRGAESINEYGRRSGRINDTDRPRVREGRRTAES